MNIERKIEEIRRQPEHIKLRYIYALMAISLVFVLLIWFFSFFAVEKKSDKQLEIKNQTIINDFNAQKKSMQDATNDAKKSINDLNNKLSN